MITLTGRTADYILQLRHQVLRLGLPITEVIFPEDHDQGQNREQTTRHYGAF
ncbi:hypothetical protein [Acaryochloris marina]|uniref:Uncharacterized protein n=1 Tax=Acaryochloris marina (strain MBIC 11017) TaxID=329726 RepID=A8ZQK6_ACAM1|nr:hypothetical protein [Acaryochloris marina]ABW33292.1 hypothetical protein AM1_G0112 [Acaryochloris marina MBIC11017]